MANTLRWPRAEPRELLAASGLFVGLLLLYALTMPRTVILEDSGLFLIAAHEAGVNHPPGYPLHALIGHAFGALPFGSVASRVNAVSAVFGAATCVWLWVLSRALGLGGLPSFLAGLAYGVSRTFWSQSIIAEVYTLNAFFCFGVLVLCLRVHDTGSPRALRAAALLSGLSLSNHWPLFILFLPSAVPLLWSARRRLIQDAPVLALHLLIGLSPYLWMVWRSQQPGVPAFLGPIESLSDAFAYILRLPYAAPVVGTAGGRLVATRFFAGECLMQLTWVGASLAAIGCALQWRRWSRPIRASLCWASFGVLAALIGLQPFEEDFLVRAVVRVYPIAAYGVLALWLGLAVDTLLAALAGRRLARRLAGGAAAAAVAAIGAVNFEVNDRHDDRWAERYGRIVLENLKPDAALFTSGDPDTGPIGYLHLVLGVRPDVELYSEPALVFGNRLYAVHTPEPRRRRVLARFVRGEARPVYSIFDLRLPGVPTRHYGLFHELGATAQEAGSRTSGAATPTRYAVEPALLAYLERVVLVSEPHDAWNRYHRDRLISAYADWLARLLRDNEDPALRERLGPLLERLRAHFVGELAAIAAVLNSEPLDRLWERIETLHGRLEREDSLTAEDVGALYYIRGVILRRRGDEGAAGREFERSVARHPDPHRNRRAIVQLLKHYAITARRAEFERFAQRFFAEDSPQRVKLERLLRRRESAQRATR